VLSVPGRDRLGIQPGYPEDRCSGADSNDLDRETPTSLID